MLVAINSQKNGREKNVRLCDQVTACVAQKDSGRQDKSICCSNI